MEFYLTGPNQGKTMRLGGFSFSEGVTEVPDKAEDAQNLLRLFYAAHPGHLLAQDADGKLVLKELPKEHKVPLLMPQPGPTPPLPNAVHELPGGQKIDEAGAVGTGKGKGK